jgi:predicted O-methyltransferase YrrM
LYASLCSVAAAGPAEGEGFYVIAPVFSYWDKPDHKPIERFLVSWRQFFPEFAILGDSDIETLISRYVPHYLDLFRNIRIPTCKSDLALLLALYDRGGLYVDCHCGVYAPDGVATLLASLADYELIFFDKDRATQPRPPAEIFPLNSMLFARSHSELIWDCLVRAWSNVAAQRRAEQESHTFVKYDIWYLTGPWILHERLLTAGRTALRPDCKKRVRYLPECRDSPIKRYAHREYRLFEMHWSIRQSAEPLFLHDRLELYESPENEALFGRQRPTQCTAIKVTEPMDALISLFHDESPYDHHDLAIHPVDLQGWPASIDPLFEQLITDGRPSIIVEIGCWKGASAIHMAHVIRRLGLRTKIICIDTWLGSPELYEAHWSTSLRRRNGYPQLYFTFLSNVIANAATDTIIPIPVTSHHGAYLLSRVGIRPDIIYIDAAHEYEAALRDLSDFWPLLNDGGTLIGDDYRSWPEVARAANDFAKAIGREVSVTRNKFVFTKVAPEDCTVSTMPFSEIGNRE